MVVDEYNERHFTYWKDLFEEPLGHGEYLDLYEFEIFHTGFYGVICLCMSVVLFGLVMMSVLSDGVNYETGEKEESYVKYMNPFQWLVFGNTRSLGIIFLLVSCIWWGLWGGSYITTSYYEASPGHWDYIYDYVIISNGEKGQINEIRQALHNIKDENELKKGYEDDDLYLKLLDGIPLSRYEQPTPYQQTNVGKEIEEDYRKGQTHYGRPYNSTHNPIQQDGIDVSDSAHPRILTIKHMFDREIPKIYYPTRQYWLRSAISAFFYGNKDSFLTTGLFLSLSSLPPVFQAIYGKNQDIIGSGWMSKCMGYALLRLVLYPTLDILRQPTDSFNGKRKENPGMEDKDKINDLTNSTYEYMAPYDTLRMEQSETIANSKIAQEQIKTDAPDVYEHIQNVWETSHNMVLNRPILSAWVIGILKLYLCAIERLIIMFLLIYLYKEWNRYEQDAEYDGSYESFPSRSYPLYQRIYDFESEMEIFTENNNIYEPKRFISLDLKDNLIIFGIVLFIQVILLTFISMLYFLKPHGEIIEGSPLLQDLFSTSIFVCDGILVLFGTMILLPRGHIHGLPECLKQQEIGESVKPFMQKSPQPTDEDNLSTISSLNEPNDEEISIGREPQTKPVPKHEIPNEYPLPEWVQKSLLERPEILTTNAKFRGDPDLGMPHLPRMNVNITINNPETPTLVPSIKTTVN